MGKSSSSAPTADPAMGDAAKLQIGLGMQQLNFAKEQFGIANQRQAAQDVIANQVTQQQLDASTQAQGWATEDRARQKSVFQPIQDDFIQKAQSWGSSTRQDQMAAEAEAGVRGNAALAAGQTERTLAAQGIQPGSGRFDGTERAADLGTALAAAGAGNQARTTARSQGMALEGDAANMGSGLGASAANSLSLGVNAGSSAFGTTNTNNAAARSSASIMNQGYAGAQGGLSGGAGTYGSMAGINQKAWTMDKQASDQETAGIAKGIGTVAGMALAPATGGASMLAAGAMFSSKELKEDKAPSGDNLSAVKQMPVQDWTYKDGVADEGRHTGPYAEDFQAATGKGDGKSIPVVDAIGVTMGAVQQLDEKVDAIAKAMEAPKARGIKRAAA